jgi:transposase
LVAERTALINQLRALLLERGITVPQGRRKLERLLAEILGDEGNGLGPRLRRLIADMREEWRGIDRRISDFDHELSERARAEETTRRLMRIPGIGVLTATALVTAVGNARTFTRGLRTLLIHGARTALPGLAKSETPLGHWLKGLLKRAHRNVAIVALANKLSRIAWAVLAHDRHYVTIQVAGD